MDRDRPLRIVLLLTTPLIIGRVASPVGAQEATPAAGPIRVMELAPGIAIELFAAVPSARAPGQTVYLARLTFQPGAEIIPHATGTSSHGVATGSFGWTLLEGSAQVTAGPPLARPRPRRW